MTVVVGDCVEVMARMEAGSVDAVVTDPPYGLEFMGKEWDSFPVRSRSETDARTRATGGGRETEAVGFARGIDSYNGGRAAQQWHEAWAREAFRVLKPGGYLLAFGGTRTYHRLACAVEDAGFEIRDRILVESAEGGDAHEEAHPTELAWMYGSGFPRTKSLDVSKAIDKAAGAEREVVGYDASRARPNRTYEGGALGNIGGTGKSSDRTDNGATLTAPATEEAARWLGYGTALKPAHEPIVVARKPLSARNIAANVLEHGTGALNIDACRIAAGDDLGDASRFDGLKARSADGWRRPHHSSSVVDERQHAAMERATTLGRWPANVVLIHAEGCERVGTKRVESDGHYPAARPGSVEISTVGHAGQDDLEERYVSGEEVEAWECVEGCPVAALDAQSGEGGMHAAGAARAAHRTAGGKGLFGVAGGDGHRFGDTGGASRFFATFHPDAAMGQADVSVEARAVEIPGLDPARAEGAGGAAFRDAGAQVERERESIRYESVSAPDLHAGILSDAAPPFRYVPKASRSEREAGLLGKVPCARCGGLATIEHRLCGGCGLRVEDESCFCSACGWLAKLGRCVRNDHPTVKPIDVMRWLLRLVTPPGGTVLEPFAGSGTTLCAGALEGVAVIGIEEDERSAAVADARAEHWAAEAERERRAAAARGEQLTLGDEAA